MSVFHCSRGWDTAPIRPPWCWQETHLVGSRWAAPPQHPGDKLWVKTHLVGFRQAMLLGTLEKSLGGGRGGVTWQGPDRLHFPDAPEKSPRGKPEQHTSSRVWGLCVLGADVDWPRRSLHDLKGGHRERFSMEEKGCSRPGKSTQLHQRFRQPNPHGTPGYRSDKWTTNLTHRARWVTPDSGLGVGGPTSWRDWDLQRKCPGKSSSTPLWEGRWVPTTVMGLASKDLGIAPVKERIYLGGLNKQLSGSNQLQEDELDLRTWGSECFCLLE